MLFNSYGFLFAFLPLTLAGVGICRQIARVKWKNGRLHRLPGIFLLAASLFFYGLGGIRHLPFLLGSMAVNFGLCRWIEQSEKPKTCKRLLTVGLVFHLGALVLFKYLEGGRFMPLAVSFYTFTQVAFLVECYGGKLKGVDGLSYGLVITYFPKMIQGPIALWGEFLPQIQETYGRGKGSAIKNTKGWDWERIFRCCYLFVLGLFKKALIADTLGKAVDLGYASLSGLHSWDAVIVMVSYTLQLYFDFSGYCDMAMGISGLFGVELPINFRSPYKAVHIIDFWKRWHITLTGFFTRYVYIPLGGSRKGRARTYVNVLAVFLVSGIWHGTGAQFLVWGMMHGVLYVITRAALESKGFARFSEKYEKMRGWGKRLLEGLSVAFTFAYVNVAWVFFRAPSVKDGVELLKSIVSFQGGRVNRELAACFNLDEFWYVIKVLGIDGWQYAHEICMVWILAGAVLLVFFGRTAGDHVKRAKPKVIHGVVMAALFLWSVLSLTGVSSFLYVNF